MRRTLSDRAARLRKRALGKNVSTPTPLTPEERIARWAARIAEFGVVDREYFEAQVDRRFSSDLEAIRFYLDNDKGRGLSLSPLIEPEWMAEHQPDSSLSWFDALHQEDPSLYQTGPLFDAERYAASVPAEDRPSSTLDALRMFLSRASTTTVLPLPLERRGDRDLPWLEERQAAVARAKAFARAQWRTRRRHRPEWDGEDVEFVLERYARGVTRARDERPFVSVILPVFRRPDTIANAIRSVQQQSYGNWELIVVDDGSGDTTADEVEKVSAADERITLIKRPHEGAGAARNAGLHAAVGDFVAFLDADNTWRAHHLAVSLAALLEDGETDAVHDGVRMLGSNNAADESTSTVSFRGEDGSLEDLLAGNFIDLNALVVRRDVAEAAGPFDTRLRRWIDWEWVLRIARTSGVPRYVPVIGVDYDNLLDNRRVSSSQPASWQEVAVAPHLIDWVALEKHAPKRSRDLVSIVIPVYRDWTMTRRAVESVLRVADQDDDDVEIIIVDNGSPRPVSAILQTWFGSDRRVTVHREDRNRNFALGSDIGLGLSQGAHVVMLNNDTEVTTGWLTPLLEALEDPTVLGAQPLLLYPDGSVQTAGTVFGGDKTLPWHFLADNPRIDAQRALSTRRGRSFQAVTAAATMYRAVDLIRWRGFDPLFANGLEDVDLCLRALGDAVERGLTGASFTVLPLSVVTHHESRTQGRNDARVANRRAFDERWSGRYPAADAAAHYASAGLEYRGVIPGEPRGDSVLVRSSTPLVLLPTPDPSAPRTYRWAIKHDGTRPDDVFFLAAALEELGHTVLVDEPASFYRTSSRLDEVTVQVGTSAPWVPQPGAVNVAWGVQAPAEHFAVVIDGSGRISVSRPEARDVADLLKQVLSDRRSATV